MNRPREKVTTAEAAALVTRLRQRKILGNGLSLPPTELEVAAADAIEALAAEIETERLRREDPVLQESVVLATRKIEATATADAERFRDDMFAAAATIEGLTAANAELREALERINQWAEAYPVEMFTPLSDEEVKIAGTVLKAAGIEIGALHAGWARHILSGIGEIGRAALARKP